METYIGTSIPVRPRQRGQCSILARESRQRIVSPQWGQFRWLIAADPSERLVDDGVAGEGRR